MMLAKRTGHLAIEQELNLRCAKFFEVARYVALEKTRVTGNPAGPHEYALSDTSRCICVSHNWRRESDARQYQTAALIPPQWQN